MEYACREIDETPHFVENGISQSLRLLAPRISRVAALVQ